MDTDDLRSISPAITASWALSSSIEAVKPSPEVRLAGFVLAEIKRCSKIGYRYSFFTDSMENSFLLSEAEWLQAVPVVTSELIRRGFVVSDNKISW